MSGIGLSQWPSPTSTRCLAYTNRLCPYPLAERRLLIAAAPLRRCLSETPSVTHRTMARSEGASFHSITSSARARIDAGNLMPSALAVFTLTTSSKRVGRSIGKSEGRAPFSILST